MASEFAPSLFEKNVKDNESLNNQASISPTAPKGPPVSSELKFESSYVKLHKKVASEFALSLFKKCPRQRKPKQRKPTQRKPKQRKPKQKKLKQRKPKQEKPKQETPKPKKPNQKKPD